MDDFSDLNRLLAELRRASPGYHRRARRRFLLLLLTVCIVFAACVLAVIFLA